MMKNKPYQIAGEEQGPNVLIIGGVHGNEKLGVEIIVALKEELSSRDVNGTLALLMGNPDACDADVRFIDTDLNRLANRKILNELKNRRELNSEEERILHISPFIQKADYLLDIHCTILPSSFPFVFCTNTPRHREISSLFNNVPMVSVREDVRKTYLSSGMDFLADSYGGIGHTLEAGWMKDNDLFENTYGRVKNYLFHIGCLKKRPPVCFLEREQKQYLIYKRIMALSENFSFTVNQPKNFQKIEKGEVFAKDEGYKFIADRDSYFIFPKTSFKRGELAVNLAELV